MPKLFIVLGMVIVGLFIFDPQLTSTWSCNAEFDLGMRDLNSRKASYLEQQQNALLRALEDVEKAPLEETY